MGLLPPVPAVGIEKVWEIKNERQKSGWCTQTLWGDTGARRRVLPRGAGRGETHAREPDREKLGHFNWVDCSHTKCF